MSWPRSYLSVFLVLVLVLIAGACASTSSAGDGALGEEPTRSDDAGNSGSEIEQPVGVELRPVCAAYEALRVVDIRLLVALDQPFRMFDFLSVDWRNSIGLVRLAMYELSSDDWNSAADDATRLLEMAQIAHSNLPHGGWGDKEVVAGLALLTDAEERCEMDLSEGFLGFRLES